MIWNSIVAMAAIDVLIVTLVVVAAFWFRRQRHTYEDAEPRRGAKLILSGLSVVGLFYFLDLFVMLVLPSLIPMPKAMAVMTDLHLEYSWLVAVAFISLLVFGFLSLHGDLITLNARLEQRVAERTRQLAREKEKAESYLDNANTMFVALDRDGKVTLVNRKLCEVLGYAEDELIGHEWHDVCVPGDESQGRRARFLDRIGQPDGHFLADHGREMRVLTKSGETRIISWSDSAIRDEDGRLVGILGAAEDITEQRRTEMELRQAQRSEALANLAGGIAHSLNNLLVPIGLLTDTTLRHLPEDSRDRTRLTKVIEASNRAGDLVKRILAFSRRDEPRPVACDIAALVEETLDLLRQTTPTSITIRSTIDPDTGPVFADPIQIETVILNLVTNAAAAIGNATGRIDVTVARVRFASPDKPPAPGLEFGDYARITVLDDGPGIDEHTMARLFDPFFTTKGVGEGTGLGLSIAEGVIRSHGGSIRLTSEPGAGASFEILLPLRKVRIPAEATHPT